MIIVKAFGAKIVTLLMPATLIGVWQGIALAALSDESSVRSWIVYALIAAVVVIAIIAVFNNNLLTRILGRLGHSSGRERGPRPGEGAVIHHSSGEGDFDGSPGDAPPPIKDPNRDLPYPRKKSAD